MRITVPSSFRFLSTPSARRATFICYSPPRAFLIFLSTPSARRATLALHLIEDVIGVFLSTPSARRATCRSGTRACPCPISIHALREEGDYPYFHVDVPFSKFLSTPSARRATGNDTE